MNILKKSKLISILSFLLVVTGLILMFLPQINAFIIELRTNENLETVSAITAEDLQNNLNSDSSFEFDLIDEISASTLAQTSGHIDPRLYVARLYIPAIEMNLPVYNGVTNDLLNAGAGTMRPGLTMGTGNFPIAGHYAHTANVLFADLTELEVGDDIYLTDNEHIYEYRGY